MGIAFAIPASTAKVVVNDLMKNGSVQRGWLGVQIQNVTKDIADSLGLNPAAGALVSGAQDDSPAKKAGIVAGDVITKVNGAAVANPKELAREIAGIIPGSNVTITVWRNGKAQDFTVALGTLPDDQKQASADGQQPDAIAPDTLADLGLTVTGADDGNGLVVTDVDPNSDAADRGLQTGDIITSVNSNAVKSSSDLSKAMSDAAGAGRKSVLVQITRNGNSSFVTLPVAKS